MTRRDMLAAVAAGAAPWPFPSAATNQWTSLQPDGFAAPVPALTFDGARLESGLPLGGLGTGYMTLEGSGKLGFSSIYNELVPPKRIFADWLVIQSGTRHVPLSAARISYWGHFPVADLNAEFSELPLSAGLRAFSPFIVGDAAVSNTPAALFELELRNTSDRDLPLTLALHFPAPPSGASLAARGEGLTERNTVEVTLPARHSRRVRFAVAWHAPSWRDSGGEAHVNRYAQRFAGAAEAADRALGNYDAWLRRVLAWQSAVYGTALPEWLRDALIQSLYSLAKNSVWIARTRKDEWWGDNGWFTHSESHTGCPIVETMVCRQHGHFPLLFFFPELEETTLDAFRHFQIADGEVPFSFGQPTSMRDPRYHCQHPLNSGQYAQMVHRLWARSGDRARLQHFYESARRAIRYQYSLDDCGCGLVHEQPHARPGEAWPANQFYDVWPWHGVSAYVAGTWLATLSAGKALAEAVGDAEFQAECAARLAKAQQAYDSRLWTGSYYRLWDDTANGKTSEVCLANQMMGEWCARVAGLPGVLPAARVTAVLDTLERLNLRATSYGLINAVTPDGRPFDSGFGPGDHARNIFVGENLCAAMTFLYHGRRDTGLEIAKRMYEAMAVKTRSPWNQRCLLNGQTGLPQWGDDYYSNLVIWTLPVALNRESVAQFELPARMIAAAR